MRPSLRSHGQPALISCDMLRHSARQDIVSPAFMLPCHLGLSTPQFFLITRIYYRILLGYRSFWPEWILNDCMVAMLKFHRAAEMRSAKGVQVPPQLIIDSLTPRATAPGSLWLLQKRAEDYRPEKSGVVSLPDTYCIDMAQTGRRF